MNNVKKKKIYLSLNHGILVILCTYFSDFNPSNRNKRRKFELTHRFISPYLVDEKKKTAIGYMKFIPPVSKKHRK